MRFKQRYALQSENGGESGLKGSLSFEIWPKDIIYRFILEISYSSTQGGMSRTQVYCAWLIALIVSGLRRPWKDGVLLPQVLPISLKESSTSPNSQRV